MSVAGFLFPSCPIRDGFELEAHESLEIYLTKVVASEITKRFGKSSMMYVTNWNIVSS
jgi:hypothetical protein